MKYCIVPHLIGRWPGPWSLVHSGKNTADMQDFNHNLIAGVMTRGFQGGLLDQETAEDLISLVNFYLWLQRTAPETLDVWQRNFLMRDDTEVER